MRKSILYLILLIFGLGLIYFNIIRFQLIQNTSDSTISTIEDITSTQASTVEELLTTDPFQLTVTSIIATATADRISSQTPCESFQWTVINFYYSVQNGEAWKQNPNIVEQTNSNCLLGQNRVYSHKINISHNELPDNETLSTIIGDVISRLPNYPPNDPQLSETIVVINFEIIPIEYGNFSYSKALTAYETNLRDLELLDFLGVQRP